MVSIPRPSMPQRRSTQSSIEDTPHLGRNALFMGGSSMSKLSSISGDTECGSRDQSTSSLIPLTQTVSPFRESRIMYIVCIV